MASLSGSAPCSYAPPAMSSTHERKSAVGPKASGSPLSCPRSVVSIRSGAVEGDIEIRRDGLTLVAVDRRGPRVAARVVVELELLRVAALAELRDLGGLRRVDFGQAVDLELRRDKGGEIAVGLLAVAADLGGVGGGLREELGAEPGGLGGRRIEHAAILHALEEIVKRLRAYDFI